MAIEVITAKTKHRPATFSQVLHRELFKRAIAWRKTLTRQERYFLECYCAGRHPFGGDRLSVNWDRFALKIYLEEVRFELVALPGSEGVRTLHVKHPALLSVVQRRWGKVIASHINLSSLKDETLAEQVGLDVKALDFIEVITLPGQRRLYCV